MTQVCLVGILEVLNVVDVFKLWLLVQPQSQDIRCLLHLEVLDGVVLVSAEANSRVDAPVLSAHRIVDRHRLCISQLRLEILVVFN